LGSGVRPAWRAGALKAVVFAVVVGSSQEPGELLRQVMLGLATRGGWSAAPILFALWAGADAHLAARRLASTLGGWHLHLPADRTARRRAFLLALAAAQGPALGIWLAFWVAAWASGEPVHLSSLVAIPLVALGAGFAMLPLRHPWGRGLGGAAVLLALMANTWMLLGSVLALLAAEWMAGPLRTSVIRPRAGVGWATPRLLPTWVAVRALGHRLPVALGAAAVPVLASWLFLRNNALGDAQAALAVRTGCGLSTILVPLQLAGHLKALRPPWGWSRSLPWSSRTRTLHDTAFLAVCSAPAVASGMLLAPFAGLALVPLAAFVALHLTGAIRRSLDNRMAVGAADVAAVCIAALAVGVSGWSACALLGLLPWVASEAVRREQVMKVSLWHAQHHDIAGDPIT
jgi:hypothetical protein